MGLISLVLATTFSAADVPVPPLLPFAVGSTSKHKSVVHYPDQGQGSPTELASNLTITEKRLEDKGVRVYTYEFDAKVAHNTIYELKTDSLGRPLQCKDLVGEAGDTVMGPIMFMLRQPLWPTSKTASTWKSTIPDPTEKGKTIPVDCSAKMDTDGETIVLTQTLIKENAERGIPGAFITVLKIQAKTGRMKSMHQSIEFSVEKDKKFMIQFDEES